MLHLNKVATKLFLLVIVLSIPYLSYGQLVVDNSLTPQQLVENVFLGGGVTVSNVSVTLEDGRQIASFTNTNSNLGISNGVMMSTGYCDDMSIAATNTNDGFTSASTDFFCGSGLCGNGDTDLENLGGAATNDAAVIEFDFIPIADTVSFRYVFASEEYNEYACSDFNDIFAFFLNGVTIPLAQTNIATIPNTTIPVAINSLNNGSVGSFGDGVNCSGTNGSLAYSSFFVDNAGGDFIEFDGMTTVLEAKSVVTPCETYHIKLAIADVFDNSFDSGVFLEAASFSSSALTVSTVTPSGDENVNEACDDATITFTIDAPATAPFDIPLTITGTATNGTDYATLPSSVTIPTGQTSVSILINPVDDGSGEGMETITIEVPTSACGTESITLNIVEEILSAPLNLECTSTTNSITFTWDDVVGNTTGWEVSLDGGTTWISPNSGSTSHIINGLSSGDAATILVRAVGACDISSTATATCSIGCGTVPIDSEALSTCDTCAELCLNIAPSSLSDYEVTLDAVVVPDAELSGCGSGTILAYTYFSLLGNGSQGPYNLLSWMVDGTSFSGMFNNPQELVNLMNQSDPTGNWVLNESSLTIEGTNSSTNYSSMEIENLAVLNTPPSTLGINTASTSGGIGLCVPLGNHQVVVTEIATGCVTQIVDVEVTPFVTIPTPTITIDNNISCPNGNDGALSVSPSSGYDYLWNNNETTPSISNLMAGTYTVTLTDAVTGCAVTASIGIDNNNIIAANITPSANVLSCDVPSVNLDASGSTGQGALDYEWSTNATTDNIDVTSAGTYIVMITDSNGCTSSSSVVITGDTTSPSATIIASAPEINCNTPNITLDATLSTAQGVISYEWSTNETTATIDINAGGTYTITITDSSNGCTASDAITITEESVPTINETLLTCDTCATVCIGIDPSNIINYEITLDGITVPVSELSGCGLDTVLSYSYIPLLGGGTEGPYQIISWLVNQTPYFGSFNSPIELVALMNQFDPTGNWVLEQGLFIIEGGNPANTYGPIQVQNIAIPGSLSTLALNSTNMLTGIGLCVPLGDHEVIVVDIVTGCPVQIINVEVSPSTPIPPIIITESSEILCPGGNGGELSVSPSTGYDYLWSNNETTPVISNLIAGTYTVTLTDASSGCTASASATIESNSTISAIIIPNNPALNCNVTTINLDASTSTGQGVLDYEWSTNSTDASIDIASAGTYTVVVTDENGCTASSSIAVFSNTVVPSPLLIPSGLTLDCNTTSISLDASSSSSAGTLNYEWSTTETTGTINVTNAGTYTVTLTDVDNGCTNTASVTISGNATPPVTDVQSVNTVLDCSNSEAILDASGSTGTGVLDYEWSNGESTTFITTVIAGTYTVTITDNDNGCTATASIVVSEGADAPVANLVPSALALDCNVTTINLDASTSTGQGVLDYEWSTGSTDASIDVVSAGTYTVVVTDENGCTASSSIAVFSNTVVPSPLLIPSGLMLDCNTTSISLDASSSSSAGTLNYEWSTTETTGTINVTNGGTYTVTLTDVDNGCTNTASVTISENATPPVADIQSVNTVLDCSNSEAILDASGSTGTGVLDYEWSNGESTTIITTVIAGTYTVTITDNENGCTATASIVVSEGADAPVVNIESSETEFNCSITTITLDASTSTGQGTLDYEWSTGSMAANIDITGQGLFTVTVTDNNGCTSSGEINISSDPTLPNAIITLTDTTLTCIVGNITLDASSSTGNGTLSYEWQDASTAATFTVGQAGTYTVTITDENNCTASTSVTINENTTSPIADINPNVGNVLNCETTSIELDASVSTGSGLLSYEWQNGSAEADFVVTNPGTYTVTVTDDANGCTALAEIEITEDITPPTLDLVPTGSILDCNVNSINIDAGNSTGQGVLEYQWNDVAESMTPLITVTDAGVYAVTITDATNGCTAEGSISIEQDSSVPSIDVEATDSLLNCEVSSVTLSVIGLLDSNSATYLWSDNNTTSSIDITNAGTYTVTITQINNGCTSISSIDILEDFSEPVAVITADELELNCLVGVSILNAATASQGNNLSYEWQDGSTDSIFVVNLTGTYTVTITEANSACTSTASVTIGIDNNTPDIEITPTNPALTCVSSCDTLVASTLLGGDNSYVWSDSSSSDSLIVCSTGIYTVTVTGENGCTSTASIEVVEDIVEPEITLTSSTTVFDCINEDITIEASISGMFGATYEWSTNETGSSIIVNTPNTYTVTATDSVTGCTAIDSVTLTNSIVSMPVIVGDTAICVDGSTTLDAFIAGITSYEWSTMETTSSIIVDAAGEYTVTISDGVCTGTTMVTVTEIIVESPNIMGDAAICEDGETTLDAGDYTSYAWSDVDGSTSQTIIVDAAGTYTVTVTDNSGCTNSSSFDVSIAPAPVYSIIDNTSICQSEEITLGLIDDAATSYSWTANPNDTSLEDADTGMPSATPLETTVYTLIATNGSCTIIDSVIIAVGSPKLDVIGEDICGDGTATLLAAGSPDGGTYSWTDEDGNEIGTEAMIDVNPTSTATYDVSYTLGDCVAISTITVNVTNDPNISITSSGGVDIIAGEGTLLTVENVPSGSTYLWTASDGETSEDEDFEVNPLDDVYYTVEITTPEGCAFFAEINISVTTLDLAIPNLFTPNGDELNDRFYIINAELLHEVLEFQVFDRWGEVVHNAPVPWDGTYKGKNMPSDIYVYFFKVRNINGEERALKGDVTLMR